MAIGDEGRALADVSFPFLEDYARRCRADFAAITEPTLPPELRMLEKLRLRDYLGPYDRVLWLDADVLARPDAPDLFGLVPPTHWASGDHAAYCPDWFHGLFAGHLEETCREEGLPVPDGGGRYFCLGVQLVPAAFAWLYEPRRHPSTHDWAEQSVVNARLFARPGAPVYCLPECFGRLVYWPDRLPRRHLEISYLVHYAGPPSREQRVADMRRDAAVLRERWGGLTMELHFRDGTWDRAIWREVVDGNAYGLTARYEPDEVVLDVGAHVGSFTYLALDRGAGRVLAVEPCPENAAVWRHNLHAACRATDRAVLVTGAAWPVAATLRQGGPAGPNTGGRGTLGNEGAPVAGLPLDALVDLAASLGPTGRVRLVKLDCEGAEWPLLLGCRRFGLIDAWVGEYHTLLADRFAGRLGKHPAYDATVLERVLRDAGYRVSLGPERDGSEEGLRLGTFRAWREGKEP
jgi:FkbM family methyltransferase